MPYLRLTALGLGVVFLALSPAALAQPEPAEALDASVFWQEFAADKNGAEERYVGQPVTVKGVVTDTGTSIYMTPNVKLSNEINGPTHVICVLPRAHFDQLETYKPGDQVIMTGRVYRHGDNGVVIKECGRFSQ